MKSIQRVTTSTTDIAQFISVMLNEHCKVRDRLFILIDLNKLPKHKQR